MTDHNHTGAGADAGLAGDDDGQIESGATPIPPQAASTGKRMQPAVERATLRNDDRETINAVQVAMDRSGAEHIDAQRVTLERSGAKSLSAQTAELNNSGSVTLSATTATFSQSSVLLAQTKELRLEDSKAFVAMSGKTFIAGSGGIGIIQTGSVEASGDVNGLLIMTGSVKAGGDVNVTFDAVSAGVLGTAFAATLMLLRWLVGRKR